MELMDWNMDWNTASLIGMKRLHSASKIEIISRDRLGLIRTARAAATLIQAEA